MRRKSIEEQIQDLDVLMALCAVSIALEIHNARGAEWM